MNKMIPTSQNILKFVKNYLLKEFDVDFFRSLSRVFVRKKDLLQKKSIKIINETCVRVYLIIAMATRSADVNCEHHDASTTHEFVKL